MYELVRPNPKFREPRESYAQCSAKHHHHHIIDQHLNEIDDIALFVAFCKMSQTSSVVLDWMRVFLLYMWDSSLVTKAVSCTKTKQQWIHTTWLKINVSWGLAWVRMHTLYMNWVKASKMKVYQVRFPPLFKQLEYWSGVRRSLDSSDFVIPKLWTTWSLWVNFFFTWRDSVGLRKITIRKEEKFCFKLIVMHVFSYHPCQIVTLARGHGGEMCSFHFSTFVCFLWHVYFGKEYLTCNLFLCKASWTYVHDLYIDGSKLYLGWKMTLIQDICKWNRDMLHVDTCEVWANLVDISPFILNWNKR